MSDDATAPSKGGGSTISAAVAAKLIGVTPQWLTTLERGGYITKVSRGQYNLVNVVQGYIKYLKDEDRSSKKTAGDTRLKDMRAAEVEQRMMERQNTLKIAALEAAMAIFDEAAGGLKADLLSIPARVTKDIPLRRRIEAEINDALSAASKRATATAKEHGADRGPVGQPADRPSGRLGKAKPGVRAVKRRSGKA
jgi:hypothetical protein